MVRSAAERAALSRRMQFRAKGALDGGFIDAAKLRIGVRKALVATEGTLEAAEAALAQFAAQKTAMDQAHKQAETAVHRCDAARKKAAEGAAEAVRGAGDLKNDVRCCCMPPVASSAFVRRGVFIHALERGKRCPVHSVRFVASRARGCNSMRKVQPMLPS